MQASESVRVGFTGHQRLTARTTRLVEDTLRSILMNIGKVWGITSLAEGSDQIFARCVIELGGTLTAVIPSADYETTFDSQTSLAAYRELLRTADAVDKLPFSSPSEEAFWQAGRRVVEDCEQLIAVWDGKPAVGLGGTADVVNFARSLGRPIVIVWPEGAERETT